MQLERRIESRLELFRLAQLGWKLRDGVGAQGAERCPQIDP